MSSTELTTTAPRGLDFFTNAEGFALANRIGTMFSASTLVPQQYQGNVANCIIALEMAQRMGASPMLVMQNLYIVHGNPGWSSKFLIACFNQTPGFSKMRFRFRQDAQGNPIACRAWAVERETGEELIGSEVSIEMAKAEGWSTKNGSKWKTMPELMLQYRAAAFFIRIYAPELTMGMQTEDELRDIIDMETGEITNGEPRGKPAVRQPRAKAEPAQLAERVDTPQNQAPDTTEQPTATQGAESQGTGDTPSAGDGVDADEARQAEATGSAETPQADASNAEAKPEVAAPAPAAGPVQQAQPATKTVAAHAQAATPRPPSKTNTYATPGERKFVENRCRSNDVDLAALLAQHGVASLETMTTDDFIAIKDALNAAAK